MPPTDRDALALEAVEHIDIETAAISLCWSGFISPATTGFKSAKAYWRKVAPFQKERYREEVRQALRTVRAAGLVALPVEPADDVIEVMAAAHEASPCMDLIGPMEAAYRAMLAALQGEAG